MRSLTQVCKKVRSVSKSTRAMYFQSLPKNYMMKWSMYEIIFIKRLLIFRTLGFVDCIYLLFSNKYFEFERLVLFINDFTQKRHFLDPVTRLTHRNY